MDISLFTSGCRRSGRNSSSGLAKENLIIFPQMLTVRQTDDVVVHLPPMMVSSNTSTMPSYMVIALHGMGPNYPDLFQHEVKKKRYHLLPFR